MQPEVGQVVTVFRSRLRADAAGYAEDATTYSIQVGVVDHASGFPHA